MRLPCQFSNLCDPERHQAESADRESWTRQGFKVFNHSAVRSAWANFFRLIRWSALLQCGMASSCFRILHPRFLLPSNVTVLWRMRSVRRVRWHCSHFLRARTSKAKKVSLLDCIPSFICQLLVYWRSTIKAVSITSGPKNSKKLQQNSKIDNKNLKTDNKILNEIRTSSTIPFHFYLLRRLFPIPIR